MGVFSTIKFIWSHPLASRRRLAAMADFARWQIGSRVLPGDVVVAFVDDARLMLRPGMTGGTGNVYVGLHEFEDMAFVLHLLRRDDLFVDVGANVGSYTVLAGAAGARCVAFEPVPAAFRRLEDNVRLNRLETSVRARMLAVGARSGVLRFTTALDTVNHVVARDEHGLGVEMEVPVEPLDEALGEETPTIIKIDVEGYETEVLLGARRTLGRDSLLAVVIELNGSGKRYGHSDLSIHRTLTESGFRPFRYEPFSRVLRALNGVNREGGNTLYVRDDEAVQDRLTRAPRFRVKGMAL